MIKPRIPETDHGIQGQPTVAAYDQMQRALRDKGWIETEALLKAGINEGVALEVGHGPGYLGLEWLQRTQNTTLVGLDISPDMNALVKKNAGDYHLSERTQYRLGNCDRMPFEDQSFDAVFTNGSLHEWANPRAALKEIWRVLKPGGHYFIADLRRDMNFFLHIFLWLNVRPVSMRQGLNTSIQAAYTPAELRELITGTRLENAVIHANAIEISISGSK